MSSIIKHLIVDGTEKLRQDGDDAEKTKVGTLRGGNTGIYIKETGKVLGKSAREAYLRFKGIQIKKTEPNRSLMFQAGRFNEDAWMEVLSRAWEGEIKCEEDIPTCWETENGIKVTGRPDMVLLKDGKPHVGLELKLASSIWTCRDVLFEDTPRFDHLTQAAHYMWQTGCPFELWYANRVDFHPNEMVDRLMPRYGTAEFERLKENFETSFYKMVVSKKGNKYRKRIKEEEFKAGRYGWQEGDVNAGMLKIYPFTAGFKLGYNKEGFLQYTSIQTGKTYDTPITVQRIKDFFELVSKVDETGELPPRTTGCKPDGTKLNYDINDYSPIGQINKDFESLGLEAWLTEVKKLSESI